MTVPTTLPDDRPASDTEEISLIELLIVLAKNKRLILGMPVVAAILAAGVSLMMPDLYTATTKVLPPQQSQSGGGGLLAQLGGLGLAGLGSTSSGVYIAMLKSRTVSDRLAKRFSQVSTGGDNGDGQGREGPPGVANITLAKDGLLTIDVDDTDPQRAADLANAYVEELVAFTQVLAITEASKRRLFFERQLVEAKNNLANAEASFKKALERGGISRVDDQAATTSGAINNLRGQIISKEVQVDAMRGFAADRNPELNKLQVEIESMKRQLAKLEGRSGPKVVSSRPEDEGKESVRLGRDLKYSEVVFDLIYRQFESAKIDEARESSVIQVMDKAIPPKSPSKPRRLLIVMLSALVAFVIAIMWAFVRETYIKFIRDPNNVEKLSAFERHLA